MEVGTHWRIKRNKKNLIEDYLKGREMRTVVKDEISEWREVKNRVPHESVLAPIMFFHGRIS